MSSIDDSGRRDSENSSIRRGRTIRTASPRLAADAARWPIIARPLSRADRMPLTWREPSGRRVALPWLSPVPSMNQPVEIERRFDLHG